MLFRSARPSLASREKGVPLVNISQTFKKSGLELTCRADTGIKKPTDLKGKTVGIWYGGNEYPFLSWMSKLGYKTDGSPGGVKMLKQGLNVDPLLQKQAECISTMTYNEYWQVIDAGYKPSRSWCSSMTTRASARLRTACGCWRASSRIRRSSPRWRSSCRPR